MHVMPYSLHLGDAIEFMQGLEAGSVDAVITDPPYGTGNWKRPGGGAGANGSAVYERHVWDEWSNEPLELALERARTVVMFCPASKLSNALPVVEAAGRAWRVLYWLKTDPRPRFTGQLAFGCEPILAIGPLQPASGPDYVMASSPRINRDTEAVGHPHQKPLRIMRWLVQLASKEGETILDPFAGSGSTGVAALKEGRRFIGSELDPNYHTIALKRLQAAHAQPRLMEAM